jgi:hypothetical protein
MKLLQSDEPEDEPEPPTVKLTDDDRLALRVQFSEVHADSQVSYDSSIRTFAAGGVALTASIAAAIHTFGALGTATIAVFIASLALTQLSHMSTQHDMLARIDNLEQRNDHRLGWNRWTTTTTWLNHAAGLALLAGGILLAVFVGGH